MKTTRAIAALAGAMGLVLLATGQAVAAEPATAAPATSATAPSKGCEPDGTLQFICGPKNAEDIVRLGSGRWLLVSGMDGGFAATQSANGRLYLVDHREKAWREVFPGPAPAFRHDRSLFGGCPGPLDTKNFSAHGLALRERQAGRYRLYVTGHGAREAIEVFDVDATGATPNIAWIGCVLLPEDVSANSVAILPDWGFVTTKFLDRRLPQQESFAQVRQGQLNGALYEWHPGGQVKVIPGTELSAPNGIEISPDGNTIFVAAFGSREVVRFRRGAGALQKDSIKVGITPDNIRWSAGGKLLTAGGDLAAPGAATATAWSVIEVDPATLATRRVAGGASSTGMQAISVGTDVGDEIWVGTFNGDRIGYQKTR
jgi:hypothetical protein